MNRPGHWVAIVGIFLSCLVFPVERAPAQEPMKIKVGWGIPVENVKYIMMKKPEILKNYGKVYTVEWINFPTTPPQAQALAAGQIDGGTLASVSLAKLVDSGAADVRVVTGIIEERPGYFATAWLVAADSGIKSVRDLKGKTIGTSVYGGYTNIVGRGVLKKNGLDPDKDVKIVEVPFRVMEENIRKGQVATGEQPQHFYTAAHKRGGMRDLFTSLDLFEAAPILLHCFRTDFITKNPAVVRAFLEDWVIAAEWMSKNRAEAMEVYASVTRIPKDLLGEFFLSRKDYYYPPDGMPNVPALQKVFDYLYETKEISKRLDAKALTDLRYHPGPR
ncbi:MAG: ABC transporter substrate-binding protein [Candidatus Rokubacteria bacterium]|nr:ABC transporter substrate-binding protein [Candidatus Rokubacteria bacterium]